MPSSNLLSLVLAIFLVGCAQACTQIIMGAANRAYPTEVMSARNMGFFGADRLRVSAPLRLSSHVCQSSIGGLSSHALHAHPSCLPVINAYSPTLSAMQWDVVSIPAGFNLVGLPIMNNTPNVFPKPTRYGIVCIAANTKALATALADDATAAAKFSGICVDGMNEAGLSVGFLWDETNKGYLNSSDAIDPSKETVSFLDFPTRILAECSTVQCARTLVGRLNIVTTDFISQILNAVIGYVDLPQHMTFCDKSARCIVVEWTSHGKPEVFDLEQDVLTNEPHVPIHRLLYADYMKASLAKYGEQNMLLDWPGGIPSGQDVMTDTDPSGRYIRMAMLMQFYGPIPYPNPKSLASPEHYRSKIAAFAQINSIINYAVETGAAPANHTYNQWAGQMSHFVTTRDHKAGDFYVRVPYNMNPHRINVRKQTRSSPNKIRFSFLDELIPASQYAVEARF